MISTYKLDNKSSNNIFSKRIIQSRESSNQHLCISPILEFNIAERALIKLFLMAKAVSEVHNSPYEIYALCIGKDLTIEDIYIPYQNVTYVSIHIDGDMIYHARQEIRAQKFNIIGWAHSHADFSVFSSGTDNENHKTVLHETSNYIEKEGMRLKYMVAMTVNMKENVYGVTLTHYPCGIIKQSEASVRVIRDPDDVTDEWIYYQYLKLKNIVKERVKTSGFLRAEYKHESYQTRLNSPSSDYAKEDVISSSSLFDKKSNIPKLLQQDIKPTYEAGYLSRYESSRVKITEITPDTSDFKQEIMNHNKNELSEKKERSEKQKSEEILNRDQSKDLKIRKSSSGTIIYQQNTPTKVYNINDFDSAGSVPPEVVGSAERAVDVISSPGSVPPEAVGSAEKAVDVVGSSGSVPPEAVGSAEKAVDVVGSSGSVPPEAVGSAEKAVDVVGSSGSVPPEAVGSAEKAVEVGITHFENKNKDLNETDLISNIDSIKMKEAISLTETELSQFETEFVKKRAEDLRAKFGIGEKNLHRILHAFSKKFKIE